MIGWMGGGDLAPQFSRLHSVTFSKKKTIKNIMDDDQIGYLLEEYLWTKWHYSGYNLKKKFNICKRMMKKIV